MKKIISALLIFIFMFGFAACGTENKVETSTAAPVAAEQDNSSVDVDLTQLSSTMVYSEVYNMMTTPENYIGKVVKMSGDFALYSNEAQNYYACVIADATACCQQGLEFVLTGDKKYPDDYPKVNDKITVTGVFETYYEGENRYCHLVDASLAA